MFRFLTVVLLALGLAGCSTIGDFFRDEDNAEPPAPLTPIRDPLPVKLLWSGGTGVGTSEQRVKLMPAVADGVVYVADREGRLTATDAESGKRLWARDTRKPVSTGPAVYGGNLLVGTSEGEVLMVDAEGEDVWVAEVTSEVLATPAVYEDIVVARSVDGRVTGIDADTGQSIWTFQQATPVLTLRGTGKPAIGVSSIIVGFSNGKLAALDPRTGDQIWATRIAVPHGRSELDRIVDIDADLDVYYDVIYSAAYQNNVSAVSTDSGVVLWKRDLSVYAGMAVDIISLFVADDVGRVWSLEPSNGVALWRQSALRARSVTEPALHGDYVVVGDFEGYLHWMARDTGRIVARRQIDSAGITVAPVVVDDTLFVLGNSGKLAAVDLPAAPVE